MKRPVNTVRKRLILLAALLICLICVSAAAAAAGTTEYKLDKIQARLSLSDSYIVLTPDNLSEHAELLSSIGKTQEELAADWEKRGVMIQAWVPSMEACLEISAVADEDGVKYYDIDAQTRKTRDAYRNTYAKGTKYSSMGYTFTAASWKKYTKGGRFLNLKYKHTENGYTYRGYAARTIRNGYTITLDYQVYKRRLEQKDARTLSKVTETVSFDALIPTPASATGLISFTSVPPEETNNAEFTVAGTTTPNAHLIGVLMRTSNSDATRIETDAGKSGKFKMNVKLPTEGIWCMTITVCINNEEAAFEQLGTITYDATHLPLSLNQKMPQEFQGDEYELSGRTVKNVSVQCVVQCDGQPVYEKIIKTNATGKFRFDIPTSKEGQYSVVLSLQKKKFITRRDDWTVTRTLTELDKLKQEKGKAIKPAYSTLIKKMDGYMGRVMGYKVYIKEIKQVGDEWLIEAALTRTRKGTLKDLIVITAAEDPGFLPDSEHKMYGTFIGTHSIVSEEDTESLPAFDLLFWE